MNTEPLRPLTLVVVTGIALAIGYRDHFDAAALDRWMVEAGACNN